MYCVDTSTANNAEPGTVYHNIYELFTTKSRLPTRRTFRKIVEKGGNAGDLHFSVSHNVFYRATDVFHSVTYLFCSAQMRSNCPCLYL